MERCEWTRSDIREEYSSTKVKSQKPRVKGLGDGMTGKRTTRKLDLVRISQKTVPKRYGLSPNSRNIHNVIGETRIE